MLEILERNLRFSRDMFRDYDEAFMGPRHGQQFEPMGLRPYEPTAIEHCQIAALQSERNRLQGVLDEITGVAERRRKQEQLQWMAGLSEQQATDAYQHAYGEALLQQIRQAELDILATTAPPPFIIAKDQIDPDVLASLSPRPGVIIEYQPSPSGPPTILQSIGLSGVFGSGS